LSPENEAILKTFLIQLFSFGLTGVVNTLSNLLVAWYVYHLTANSFLAILVGYIFSMPIHFYVNYKVVFKSDQKVSLALAQYFYVVLCSYLFSNVFIFFLITLLGVSFFFAMFLNVFAVAVFSFILFRHLL